MKNSCLLILSLIIRSNAHRRGRMPIAVNNSLEKKHHTGKGKRGISELQRKNSFRFGGCPFRLVLTHQYLRLVLHQYHHPYYSDTSNPPIALLFFFEKTLETIQIKNFCLMVSVMVAMAESGFLPAKNVIRIS